jgi:hypothetical protein
MKKQILNLGKGLSKAEQKNVFGGYVEEEGCLAVNAYCRSDATQKCCGTCKLGSGRNGLCE